MNNDQIHCQVLKLLGDYFSKDPADVKMDSRLVHDLGADSLDMVALAMALEDEFCLMFLADIKVKSCVTVGDIIALIQCELEANP